MWVYQPEGGAGKYASIHADATKKPNQSSVAAAHAIYTFIPRTLFPFWAEGLESHGRDPDAWLKILRTLIRLWAM
jgi:hypothetical protein